jgi:hypothetical protein
MKMTIKTIRISLQPQIINLELQWEILQGSQRRLLKRRKRRRREVTIMMQASSKGLSMILDKIECLVALHKLDRINNNKIHLTKRMNNLNITFSLKGENMRLNSEFNSKEDLMKMNKLI